MVAHSTWIEWYVHWLNLSYNMFIFCSLSSLYFMLSLKYKRRRMSRRSFRIANEDQTNQQTDSEDGKKCNFCPQLGMSMSRSFYIFLYTCTMANIKSTIIIDNGSSKFCSFCYANIIDLFGWSMQIWLRQRKQTPNSNREYCRYRR